MRGEHEADVLSESGSGRGVSAIGERACWLIKLRWLAVVVVFGIVTVAVQLFHVQLMVRELYLIGCLLALSNVIFFAVSKALRIAEDGEGRKARTFANMEITTDLLVLAALIHYSGGIENPFAFYFIFHIIVSGTLLSPKEAWLQAAVAIAVFCGMVELERAGVIAHIHVPGLAPPELFQSSLFVLATVVAFASTICLAVFTAISITKLVREKQAESETLIGQLQEAYRKLDQLERSKSQHMRRVSHELRAPMGAIQNLLAMLEDGLAGDGRESERELAARAGRRTDQALKLVDDLLILARTQDARFTVTMKEVSLQHAINDVVGGLRPRADKSGVALMVDIPRNLPHVLGDPEALEQLFTNLAANAVKYTPKGGEVRISAVDRGNQVMVKVADSGIGISDEDLPHVFEEFYRGENAREFAEQGTGLGLSIVKSIADLHGAQIRVESETGRGTTFEVTFPTSAMGSTQTAEEGNDGPYAERG